MNGMIDRETFEPHPYPPADHNHFLVTGVGGSGTQWLTATLNALGVPTGHEDRYSTTILPWGSLLGDVSFAGAPYVHLHKYTAHVTRHPLRTIDSWLKKQWFSDTCPCHPIAPYTHRRTPYALYQSHHLAKLNVDIDDHPDPICRAVTYVCHWTDWLTSTPTYKLEDLSEFGDEMVSLLVNLNVNSKLTWSEVVNANTFEPVAVNRDLTYTPLTWEDVNSTCRHHYHMLQLHAERYGYL